MFKMSHTCEKHKETGKHGPYTGKEQSIELISEEAYLVELPEEKIKSAIFNIFKELKEIVV